MHYYAHECIPKTVSQKRTTHTELRRRETEFTILLRLLTKMVFMNWNKRVVNRS